MALTSEGWSDVQRLPITSLMLVTRDSVVFISQLTQQITWRNVEERIYSILQNFVRVLCAEDIAQAIMEGANKAC